MSVQCVTCGAVYEVAPERCARCGTGADGSRPAPPSPGPVACPRCGMVYPTPPAVCERCGLGADGRQYQVAAAAPLRPVDKPKKSWGRRLFAFWALGGFLPLALIIWPPAALEARCNVNAFAGSCTFTNKNPVLPGKRCVTTTLVGAGKAAPVGSVCSGFVWPGSSKSVELGGAGGIVVELCGGDGGCELRIE